MKKSTVKTRVILPEGVTPKELEEFDKAYFELLDTLEAVKRLIETEILISVDLNSIALMTASMRSMSYQIMEHMKNSFTIVPY